MNTVAVNRKVVHKLRCSHLDKLFFDTWESVLRTAAITVMSYVMLIALLRSFGKRTLSKMNAFDFVITIALGSTLASVILIKNIALADGATAFFLLIGLQYVLTRLSMRKKVFSRIIKSKPTLLVFRGEEIPSAMRKERVATDEIMAVLREHGLGSLDEAAAVVLETNGQLTVLPNDPCRPSASLQSIEVPTEAQQRLDDEH